MLWPVSTRRFLALALALLLLITQHLGLQHVLGHALHGDGATAAHLQASPASDGMAAGAAVRATGKVTAEAASDLADDAADGLCGICLGLATLGVAAVPALLQWRALLLPGRAAGHPAAPMVGAGPGQLPRPRTARILLT